ncbi:hypothetical protein EZV62_022127 [Acer yangbiense]|uniref:Reverse transcriptase/retrotransposon-derived protein RNase H-like domain-containing protein n=1 Tax=Acer yangbiense TaxID=1000413 RepID=A0A5C7H7F2_9ROSI|nr:hypothetical protein EZV62_022127 [Acer yangbiense]
MLDCLRLTTVKALRGFLGLIRYYRKFVKNYRIISKLLIDQLKKNRFKWVEPTELAFEALKRAMTSTPVLALPDFTKLFVVETDTCDEMTTLLQHKWLSKLLGYDYEISYKKGRENIVANGLSRAMQQDEGSMIALTTSRSAWVHEIEDSYQQDTLVEVVP